MSRLLCATVVVFMMGCATNLPAPHIPSFSYKSNEKDKDGYYKYASYWFKGNLKNDVPHGKGLCRSKYMVAQNKTEWLDGPCEFKDGKRIDVLHQTRLERSLAFTHSKRQAELMEQEQLAEQRERRRQEQAAERQASQQMWANAAVHGLNTLGQSLQQSQIEQANFNNRMAQTIHSAQQQRENELERQRMAQQQRAAQQQSAAQRTSSPSISSAKTASATGTVASYSTQIPKKPDITSSQAAQNRLEEEKRQADLKAKQLAEQKKREEEKQKKELELKQKEDLRKAEEARKKQEVDTYRAAIRAGTRVGVLNCNNSKKVNIVGVLGKAKRPKHIYNDCKLSEVRYRCPSETVWKYEAVDSWDLNNACIGVGNDVRVSVNCPANQVIIEKVSFSCDRW